MIHYGACLKSIPEIFSCTIHDIDGAVDNINFPCDTVGILKLINDWSNMCKNYHPYEPTLCPTFKNV
jgi:hypothetical protein